MNNLNILADVASRYRYDYLAAGQESVEKGKYQHAILQFTWAIEDNPNNIEARIARAGLNRFFGNYEDANSDINEVRRIDYNNAKAVICLGEINRQCNRGVL